MIIYNGIIAVVADLAKVSTNPPTGQVGFDGSIGAILWFDSTLNKLSPVM